MFVVRRLLSPCKDCHPQVLLNLRENGSSCFPYQSLPLSVFWGLLDIDGTPSNCLFKTASTTPCIWGMILSDIAELIALSIWEFDAFFKLPISWEILRFISPVNMSRSLEKLWSFLFSGIILISLSCEELPLKKCPSSFSSLSIILEKPVIWSISLSILLYSPLPNITSIFSMSDSMSAFRDLLASAFLLLVEGVLGKFGNLASWISYIRYCKV